MTLEGAIRVLAGTVILMSLALYQLVGPWALLLTAFAAANLIQSAFTGFCPPEKVLRKLGFEGASCGPPARVKLDPREPPRV